MKIKEKMQSLCSGWAGVFVRSCWGLTFFALTFVATAQAGIIAQNEAAATAAGYTGFGGYIVFTGGESMTEMTTRILII